MKLHPAYHPAFRVVVKTVCEALPGARVMTSPHNQTNEAPPHVCPLIHATAADELHALVAMSADFTRATAKVYRGEGIRTVILTATADLHQWSDLIGWLSFVRSEFGDWTTPRNHTDPDVSLATCHEIKQAFDLALFDGLQESDEQSSLIIRDQGANLTYRGRLFVFTQRQPGCDDIYISSSPGTIESLSTCLSGLLFSVLQRPAAPQEPTPEEMHGLAEHNESSEGFGVSILAAVLADKMRVQQSKWTPKGPTLMRSTPSGIEPPFMSSYTRTPVKPPAGYYGPHGDPWFGPSSD
jgi:hypothetical protein